MINMDITKEQAAEDLDMTPDEFEDAIHQFVPRSYSEALRALADLGEERDLFKKQRDQYRRMLSRAQAILDEDEEERAR